jgi:hypothetical protein
MLPLLLLIVLVFVLVLVLLIVLVVLLLLLLSVSVLLLLLLPLSLSVVANDMLEVLLLNLALRVCELSNCPVSALIFSSICYLFAVQASAQCTQQ